MPGPMSEKEKADLKAALDRLSNRIGKFEEKHSKSYQTKPTQKKGIGPAKVLTSPGIKEKEKKKPHKVAGEKKKTPYHHGITNKRQADQLSKIGND